MDGIAIHWYRFLQKEAPVLTWEDLSSVLIQRFGERGLGNVYERFSTLRQSATVEEYVQDFETLVAQTAQIMKEQLPGYFLGGLKAKIRCRVGTHDSKEITREINLARDVEEELCVTGSIDES